ADLPLDDVLEIEIDRGGERRSGRLARHLLLYQHLLHGVRGFEREFGERLDSERQREQRPKLYIIGMKFEPPSIEAIACRGEALADEAVAAGADVPHRILRDDGERQCLGQTQFADRLAEVDETRRANTFNIAAERRDVEIG